MRSVVKLAFAVFALAAGIAWPDADARAVELLIETATQVVHDVLTDVLFR